jgi:ABC-type phosphate transport system substrate-binding protein
VIAAMKSNILHRPVAFVLCLALSLAGTCATADVVAVVSARSPITTLSRNEVADIFLGRVRRFPDGTVALPIDQVKGSVVRDEFYLKFATKTPAQLEAHWSKIIFTGRGQPPPAVTNGEELKRRIAANPAAIGYLDRRLLDASVREVF